MEKLIELLNESTNGRFKSEDDLRLCIEMRGYCRKFIKRLVDNDKIDLEELTAQAQEKIRLNLFGYKDNKELDTDLLLMLLSIQDNPIEFLVSILK